MSSRPPEQESRFRRAQRHGLSAWVLIPSWVFGVFTWVTFFALGLRARRRDWVITGGAYGLFAALVFVASSRPEVEADDTATTLLGFGSFVAWIGGAIHAGLVYRRSLQLAGQPPATSAARTARAARTAAAPQSDDMGLGFGNPAADYLAASQPVATPSPGSGTLAAPVEANTARERVLRRLPGVTPELARRWVAERTRRGGFRDIDDLAAALHLQPHEIVRLRPRVSFADPGQAPKRRRLAAKRGRVLDV